MDLCALRLRWQQALEEALKLIASRPTSERRCFCLNAAGQHVCPDPASAEFPRLTRHYGSVKGAWPRIVEE